jgi:hypothetical protein
MASTRQKKVNLEMTSKEKADCLLELHKAQLDHFKQTRDVELKVDIALWSLIAVSGSFYMASLF